MPAVPSSSSDDSSSLFSGFGKDFQEKVLQSLIVDNVWGLQFIEVFNVDECLDQQYLKLIANRYINYYKSYKEFPSLDLLVTILKESLGSEKDIVLREQCYRFMTRVVNNENLGDLPWVKEKAFNFCRQQILKKALGECVSVILTEKYESVVDIMRTAISTGTATNPGHDYNNDIDARYSVTYRNCVPTGIPQLDDRKILNGGLGAGEIGIVVSPTGVGKSHVLVQFAAEALLLGKNVFYYTMELNERYVGIRVDSHLTGIPSLECHEAKDTIKEFFERNKDKLGQLIIKEYPTKTITANTLRAHVEKMACKGIRPDLIVIDYAGIMRSTEKYELPRFELQCVIQELRAFAKELNLPVWTALQSNKEGAKSEFIDTTNMAESYAQAGEADFVLGLQRMSSQKSTGFGNIFVAKNRAGMDGMQYKIHLDTATSTLRVLTEEEINSSQASQAEEEEELREKTTADFRDALRRHKDKYTKLGPA